MPFFSQKLVLKLINLNCKNCDLRTKRGPQMGLKKHRNILEICFKIFFLRITALEMTMFTQKLVYMVKILNCKIRDPGLKLGLMKLKV